MIQLKAQVPEKSSGQRCDRVAADLFNEFSRARLQAWIADGSLLVDGQQLRAKDSVFGGMTMTLEAELEEQERWEPEQIPLQMVYEDEDLIVINKPVGLVVHPGAGNPSGTLLNGLLHYAPEVATVPRAGIVHRIDKDTSGLLVVAKNIESQTSLVNQLQERTVKRQYIAIAEGIFTAGGTIDEPIARHPTNRLKMAVVSSGKTAITHYRISKRFRGHTQLSVQLETGRTHQIRVHMAHGRHALVGDALYAGRPKFPKGASAELKTFLSDFNRQALHAEKLELKHPKTGEHMAWQTDLPDDMKALVQMLEEDMQDHED